MQLAKKGPERVVKWPTHQFFCFFTHKTIDIHQSYRFKMNVKLFVDILVFIRIIQLAITDIRIGISSPNIFLISLHFSLRMMRCFVLSRSFLKHASTVSVVSAALAGFDDNFCFAKSFSFSSNFSFL